jgi:hypothetical protein
MSTMKKLTLTVATLLVLAGCSDPDVARRALDNQGFDHIQTEGYRWFGCGKDDTYHTGFTATNGKGKTVTGVVCSGWFKGATVRFD